MRPAKLAILVALMAVVGGLAYWQHRRAEQANETRHALEQANAAMKDLNAADDSFSGQFTSAMTSVSSAALFDINSVPAKVDKVLELLDRYATTLDTAVSRAEAYLAHEPDKATADNVEKIRTRGKAMKAAREKLAEIRMLILAGKLVSATDLADKMSSVGWSMLLNK